jgi:hypothetical protein
MKPNILIKRATQAAQQKRREHYARINAVEAMSYDPEFTPGVRSGVITQVNADMLTEGTYREALTTYAVGYRPADLTRDIEFLAPGVPVARRFDYKAYDNAEAFYSSTSEDLRAPGGDFKNVEYTSEEVTAKTSNRGLMITLDADQVASIPDWEQRYTAMLTQRLLLNKARRALALLSAAATNTAKTWDTTAGKDPDQDMLSEIVTGADASGVTPNRVAFGPTSWSKRILAHRAQNTAGGFASAGMTPAQVAQFLGLEDAIVSQARYATSSSAKASVLSNLVLLFNAISGATTEDASNIKGFWSPCDNGQMLMVHRWDIGPKKLCLAVEHYELLKITSTLGIRQFTVS